MLAWAHNPCGQLWSATHEGVRRQVPERIHGVDLDRPVIAIVGSPTTHLLGQLALYVAIGIAVGDRGEVGGQLGPGGRQKPEWAPMRPGWDPKGRSEKIVGRLGQPELPGVNDGNQAAASTGCAAAAGPHEKRRREIFLPPLT